MSARSFTNQQLQAITARGGTVLVSAAAGSGKTTVLVERVMRMLTDPQRPVDANRLLVVTFTRAAAAEMRSRLNRVIAQRILEDPYDLALRRQKLLLQNAHIDTIHSFCASCLREFFAAANIPPDFRIADQSELKMLQNETLTELTEEQYASAQPDFIALTELLADEKGSGELERIIHRLDEFISAFPDPEEKLSELAQMYNSQKPVSETSWGRWILKRCADWLGYLVRISDRAADEMSAFPEVSEKYLPLFDLEREGLCSLIELAEKGDWDGLRHGLAAFEFRRLPSLPKDALGKERAKNARDIIKKAVTEQIPALLCADSTEFSDDLQALRPSMEKLCSLVSMYRRRMSARKAERKLLDYNDLEHMTAKLLFCRKDGRYCRTDIAREFSRRFDEILIDEYQDTNYTQDLIFRAVSNEGTEVIGDGANLFLVGDIKQSIYGFRKAVPKLFLDRLNAYPTYSPQAPSYPARIILDRNFRSRPQVTDAVNFIFSQLMTPARGGIDYNDGQQLVCGRGFPVCDRMNCELHVLSGAAAEDDDSRDIVEARYCARLIRRIIDEQHPVTDGESLRPAQYGDICIMRRSIKGIHGDAFVSQLTALGIPVAISTDSGFFASAEVCVMLSLLRAVDNPLLDIPLAAALRSPVFGFDSDALAALRTDRAVPLYANLLSAAEKGDARSAYAVELLDALRADAAAMPCDRLIASIYRRTGYLSVVQAMHSGESRRRNLLALLQHAKTYEGTGSHGLSRFLRMIDRMEEQNEDFPGASMSSAENCVCIRTMHNAKGLEFPICIVAGLGSAQNNSSAKSVLQAHGELGLGINIFDPKRRLRYPTVQREAVKAARFSDETDEELRVLYVALTRAVDKLILLTTTDTRTSTDSRIAAAASMIFEDGIDPFALGLSPSLGKWLLACALRHPAADRLREIADCIYPPIDTDAPLDVIIAAEDDPMLSPITDRAAEETSAALPSALMMQKMNDSMDYRYAYSDLRRVPAKVTASQTHMHTGSVGDVRPSFMASEGLSPTERGTALHHYMQFCDFARARTDAPAELERLVREGYLSRREGDAVDLERVASFFKGEMGALLDRADSIMREWRFTAELEPQFLPIFTDADANGETVILEGECDLLLISGDDAVIVDYKTDRVATTDALVERYSPQLRLYASAVRQVTGKRVEQCYIYSFRLSELRKVPLD